MTNPTLERAARAADPGAWMAHDRDKSWGWAEQRVRQSFETARAVLMAVLPTLGRYDVTYHPDFGMERAKDGDYVLYDDLEAILADGGDSDFDRVMAGLSDAVDHVSKDGGE